MNIGELSSRAHVSTDALRLYERRGLIRSERQANGYRDFGPETVQLVEMIKLGQRLGFRLREMEEIVRSMSGGQLSQEETAQILGQKIAEIDQRMADMSVLRGLLSDALVRACPLRS